MWSILLIIVIGLIIIRIGKRIIKRIFLLRGKSPIRLSNRREATLVKLLMNVMSYSTSFFVVLFVLEELGLDIGALLAGAGIIGLAVGFGAQNLIRDIISGFFIIFEDQFSVGDFIRIGEEEGVVEEIGLRITKLKSTSGAVHIIPNGQVVRVTNFSLHNSTFVIDIGIPESFNVTKAEEKLEKAFQTLHKTKGEFISPPTFIGVQDISRGEVILRVHVETKPMMQPHAIRSIRKGVKEAFGKDKIEITFPQTYLLQDKESFIRQIEKTKNVSRETISRKRKR
jgi:small conductance mechanosensitive channel